jgi:hypothetical protein
VPAGNVKRLSAAGDLTFWQRRHVVWISMSWCEIAVAIADCGFISRKILAQTIRNPQSAICNPQ